MIQTKIAENYTKGTTQESGVLYVDTNLTSFLNGSNGIVVYLNIGVVEEVSEIEPIIEFTQFNILSTRVLKYTQEEMKILIEESGQNFNEPITNLMIDEINKFSDLLILDDITSNSQNYFGLDVSKWEQI
jgi:hypothetical protein